MTGQENVNGMRVKLGEVDPNNSRFTDLQLLSYFNRGRNAWAKAAKNIKAVFERTSSIGATEGNSTARYVLDPSIVEVDAVFYDGHKLDRESVGGTKNYFDGSLARNMGVPEKYRPYGNSIDLMPMPSEEKLIEIFASVMPLDLPSLSDADGILSADDQDSAQDYGVFLALSDDGRDGSVYLGLFKGASKAKNKISNKAGPRYVRSGEEDV